MIRVTFCLRRRSGLSAEEFRRHWLEHGALVASKAGLLGLKRYVQAHTTAHRLGAALAAIREAGEPYDGVAEVWFDSIETFLATGQTEAGRRAGQELLDDERRFIDFTRSSIFVSEEHVIVG